MRKQPSPQSEATAPGALSSLLGSRNRFNESIQRGADISRSACTSRPGEILQNNRQGRFPTCPQRTERQQRKSNQRPGGGISRRTPAILQSTQVHCLHAICRGPRCAAGAIGLVHHNLTGLIVAPTVRHHVTITPSGVEWRQRTSAVSSHQEDCHKCRRTASQGV
jgi:hypothetical protein